MATGEGPGASGPGTALSIDELARRTGLSMRNIRAYQSRGLLPPPRRVGRSVVYDETHVERIRQVQDLQERGFNLAAISTLLAVGASDQGAEELLRLAFAPLLRHDAVIFDRDDLADRFGYQRPDWELLRQAVEHGLARELDEQRVEISSAQLAQAGLALVRLGLSARDVLALETTFMDATGQAATRAVELGLQHAWDPFAAQGYPAESWPSVVAAFERLVEQMSLVLMATFSLQLRAAAEEALRQGPRPVRRRDDGTPGRPHTR